MSFSSARNTVFLSGSRDVAHLLAQAHEVIDRVGIQKGSSEKRAVPYYWEFNEAQDRQAVRLLDLPRSTDPTVRAVVFIFGQRLGAPIPSEQDLPAGFSLPNFIDLQERGSGSARLTYTAFEFLDWLAENERRKSNGEFPVPGFVFFQSVGGEIADQTEGVQRRWLSQFFRHYFGQDAKPLPGLQLLEPIQADAELGPLLFQALAREFDVEMQIPWRQALRGLQRYEIEDRHAYFGRETEVASVAQRLLGANADQIEGILLVDGPSGVGKSSFVRAGFAGSALDNKFVDNGFIAFQCVTPYEVHSDHRKPQDAFSVLASTILPAFSNQCGRDAASNAEVSPDWTFESLSNAIKQALVEQRNARSEFRLSDAQSTFVLILDQAEQVLDAIERNDQAASFWFAVLGVLQDLTQRGVLRLLISLASDRVAEWRGLHVWKKPIPQFSLEPMTTEVADSVFRRIATLCIVSKPVGQLDEFLAQAKALIDREENDAAAILPLLSTALYGLFETVETQQNPFPDGLPPTYLTDSIEEKFERALAPVHDLDKVSTARILLSRLVAIDPETGQRQLLVTRRNDQDTGPEVALWDSLFQMRLLSDVGQGRARLVHEAVLDHWSIASEWLDDERQLIETFIKIRNYVGQGALEPAALQVDRLFLQHVLQLLTDKMPLIDAEDNSEAFVTYLRGIVAAHYHPQLDADLSDEDLSLASCCISAGIENVVLTFAKSENTGVQHLETGRFTAVYAAAIHNKYALCSELLALGCDANRPSGTGWYPIQAAASHANLDIVKLLMAHGADPSLAGPVGQTFVGIYLQNSKIADLRVFLDYLDGSEGVDLTTDASLIYAAMNGSLEVVQELVERGWNLDAKDADGQGVLHMAALYSRLEVLDFLLDIGVSPFETDNAGWTAFHVAARGDLTCFERLIQGIEPQILAGITAPWTLVEQAVEMTNPPVISHLAEIGAINLESPAAVNWVEYAINRRHSETISTLFGVFAENSDVSSLQQSPLHEAVARSRYEIVDLFLSRGADPLLGDQSGNTALHLAAISGDVRIVQRLLSGINDVDHRSLNGQTALFLAVEKMNNVVVQELLTAGADLSLADNDQATPLHIAAAKGAVIAAGVILTRITDPDARDLKGRTPLFYAAENGQHRVVRLLLDYKASRDAADNDLVTPLAQACRNGHVEVAELLMGHQSGSDSIDLDHADKFGWGAMHLSVWSGHTSVLQTLLAHGADPTKHTRLPHLTPVQIACEIGTPEVLRLLLLKDPSIDDSGLDRPSPLEIAITYQNFECAYLLLRQGARSDGPRLSDVAREVWTKRRQRTAEIPDFEALVFNKLVKSGVLPADFESKAQNPQYLALFGRLVDAAADPWAMPAMMPGDWRSIDAKSAAAKVLSAVAAAKVDEKLVDRIDGMRELELSCLWPITTVLECRLKTVGSRAESLLFLSSQTGFLRLNGHQRLHSVSGIRVAAINEEYLRLVLSTMALPKTNWVIAPLDRAQLRLHTNALDAADLETCRQNATDIRFTVGTTASAETKVANFMSRTLDGVYDVEFHLAPDGAVSMKSDKTIRKLDRDYIEGFEDGLRVLRAAHETGINPR